MRIATFISSLLLNYFILILWFVERSTPMSMSTSEATAISLFGVAAAAVLKNVLIQGDHDRWYVAGALLASVMFAGTTLVIGWGLANPVRQSLQFGSFVQSFLATNGDWLVGIVTGATVMAYGGLLVGRWNSSALRANKRWCLVRRPVPSRLRLGRTIRIGLDPIAWTGLLGRSSSFNILNDSPPGRVSDGGPEHEAGRSTWRQATPTSAITAPCPAVDGDHRL
jgi:hypothetical protein